MRSAERCGVRGLPVAINAPQGGVAKCRIRLGVAPACGPTPLAKWAAEFVEADYSLCNERPFSQRDDCTAAVANATLDSMMDTLGDATDNAVNQCLVDTWENYCDWAYQEMRTTNAPIDHACENNVETAKFLLGLKGRLREGAVRTAVAARRGISCILSLFSLMLPAPMA